MEGPDGHCQCSAVQCSAVQCSAVQCSAVLGGAAVVIKLRAQAGGAGCGSSFYESAVSETHKPTEFCLAAPVPLYPKVSVH
jgi:hypothetical protein